jgi:hypothetical protein
VSVPGVFGFPREKHDTGPAGHPKMGALPTVRLGPPGKTAN